MYQTPTRQITEKSQKEVPLAPDFAREGFFMRNCRDCAFKKCCKKYKNGKRCGKCPKK